MVKKCFLSLAACLAVTLFVGCSANQGLVRGQSPAFTPEGVTVENVNYEEDAQCALRDKACGNCGECDECCNEMSELEYLLRFYWLHDLWPCGLFCYNPENKFVQRAEGIVEQVNPQEPEYEHNYRVYRPQPGELKYPAQNSPGAVVQYPYYTHKGPGDFFNPN